MKKQQDRLPHTRDLKHKAVRQIPAIHITSLAETGDGRRARCAEMRVPQGYHIEVAVRERHK